VALRRNKVEGVFNPDLALPYELRPQDFELAMQDLYDLFFDINGTLLQKGLGGLRTFWSGAKQHCPDCSPIC
jgi:hypothetical protein